MRKIALVLCMLLPLITYAQHFSISGTVVDKSTGEPVIGSGVLQSRPVTNLGQTLQGGEVVSVTDLEGFTQLALQYPREFFERYWGSYTKVMKKYNIIRDILENDMGLELE